MKRWFLSRQGKLKGPFTLPQLQEQVRLGDLKSGDLVCLEGKIPTVASSVPGLFDQVPAECKSVPSPVYLQNGGIGESVNRWFISRQGNLMGPYLLPQLQEMAKMRSLVPEDLICQEGGSQWTTVGGAPSLSEVLFNSRDEAVSPLPLLTQSSHNLRLILAGAGASLLLVVVVLLLVAFSGNGEKDKLQSKTTQPVAQLNSKERGDSFPHLRKENKDSGGLTDKQPKIDPDSNLRERDDFGNPVKRAGLIPDPDFKGAKMLVWDGEPTESIHLFPEDNPLWKALKNKGFKITFRDDQRFDPAWLNDIDQLWIVSGQQNRMEQASYEAVEKFVESGKGLYLLADNAPYLAEATRLTQRLFDTTIEGDYPGTKIAYVRQRNLTQEEIKKYKGDYPVEDHPLFTGLDFVYEGITISHINPTRKLKTVMHASDGQILVATAANPKLRVVVDCGFTRYYYGANETQRFINKTAGTQRFGENIAVYLMGKKE